MTTFGTSCEVLHPRRSYQKCGEPSAYRYEAMGGGWFYLCASHGRQHVRICERADGWIGDIYANEIAQRSDPNRIDLPWASGPGNVSKKAAAYLRRFALTDDQMIRQFECSIYVVRQLRAGYRWSRRRIKTLRDMLQSATNSATSGEVHGL